jgi:mono/diheme cytochrome c family protein
MARIGVGLALLVVLALVLLFALAWHRSLAPIDPLPRAGFDPAQVRAGAELAAIGNCAGCHSVAGGASFAGGVPVATPFGTIYSSNITPDATAGIGGWSEAAFARALRQGVSRDGHLLYPAFPYDHFTRMSDADIGALYAFSMTREPADAVPPPNRLVFPLQFRPLLAGWNLLFLDVGPRPTQVAQGAEWNRGAYLADALAHCTACHSPRNGLGAERRGAAFAGGVAEGWQAPALNAASPSPVAWTTDALASYLASGLAADHAIAAGPMQDVAHSLSHASEADVRAMAVYMASVLGPATPERQARETAARQKAAQPAFAAAGAQAAPSAAAAVPEQPAQSTQAAQLTLGDQVYQDSCARCHDLGRQPSSSGALQLPLATALQLPEPDNLLRIVREGVHPPPGQTGRWMPAFDGTLSDAQIEALALWLRRQATDQPPWPALAQAVQNTRRPAP